MKLIIGILVVLMMQVLSVLLNRDTEFLIVEYVTALDSYCGEDGETKNISEYKRQGEIGISPSQIRGPPGSMTFRS